MEATIQRKLERVLALDIDSEAELVTALQSLGGFSNGARERRGLRGVIERKTLETNEEFLQALVDVNEQLERVGEDVKALQQCCGDMEKQLQGTKRVAGSLITRAQKLYEEKSKNEKKQLVAQAFVEKFTLSAAEEAALKGQVGTGDFFAALKRVHEINGSCKVLLRTGEAQQAGLDILDAMSELMNAAYDKLNRWVKQQFEGLRDMETVEVTEMLRDAVQMLRAERPSLLRHCVEDVERVRGQAVVDSFIAALTQGGPGGFPRPIDVHAHDAVRYVGDMLAWFHQALASEADMLRALLGDAMGSSLANIFGGVCRPFLGRLQGVCRTQQDLVVVHELRNLLTFYHSTMSQMLPEEAALLAAVDQGSQDLKQLFMQLVEGLKERSQQASSIRSDLAPPSSLHKSITQMVRIIDSQESALNEESSAEEVQYLLLNMLDPLLDSCERAADGIAPELAAVFRVNYIAFVHDALLPYSQAAEYAVKLSDRQRELEKQVAQNEIASILSRSHLSDKVRAIRDNSAGKPVASLPGLDAGSLHESIKSLEGMLFGAGDLGLALSTFEKLQDAACKARVKALIVEQLVEIYSLIHSTVHNPANGYPEPAKVVEYSPSQFQMLL